MRGRLISVAFVTMCAVSPLWAGDQGLEAASISSPPAESAEFSAVATFDDAVEPWIHPQMPDRIRAKLEIGFAIAIERVREIDACSGLFTEIGADGIETLKS
jgi:hypothetical protein